MPNRYLLLLSTGLQDLLNRNKITAYQLDQNHISFAIVTKIGSRFRKP